METIWIEAYNWIKKYMDFYNKKSNLFLSSSPTYLASKRNNQVNF